MERQGRVRRARLATVALICTAVLVAGIAGHRLSSEGRSAPERVREAPPAVSIVAVHTRAMPVILQASGFVVSEHVVQVRPQVSGLLKRIFFTEGDSVRAGQRLFLIDPAPFEADFDAAKAGRGAAAPPPACGGSRDPFQGQTWTPQDASSLRGASAEQADLASSARQDQPPRTRDIAQDVSGRSGGLAARTGDLDAPGSRAGVPAQSTVNLERRRSRCNSPSHSNSCRGSVNRWRRASSKSQCCAKTAATSSTGARWCSSITPSMPAPAR